MWPTTCLPYSCLRENCWWFILSKICCSCSERTASSEGFMVRSKLRGIICSSPCSLSTSGASSMDESLLPLRGLGVGVDTFSSARGSRQNSSRGFMTCWLELWRRFIYVQYFVYISKTEGVAFSPWNKNTSLQGGCNWVSWWRHQMEIFPALLVLCAGNSPVPMNSPHKGQWRRALMFSLICVWINDWVNNREAGDLRRHRGHYDVNVMCQPSDSHCWDCYSGLSGRGVFFFVEVTII